MTSLPYPVPRDADGRILEVARLLAEGILRSRLRRFRKGNLGRDGRHNGLEVSAPIALMVLEPPETESTHE